MAIKPSPWGTALNWSDHEDRLTAEWLQRKGILVDVGTAAQAAQTVSKDRSFHPVRQYLESIASAQGEEAVRASAGPIH
jgi:hypothetical protein